MSERRDSLRGGDTIDVLFELGLRRTPTANELRLALMNACERIATLEMWVCRLVKQVEGKEIEL